MEEGETGNTLKELDHLWTGIKPSLPRTPCLQRGAGNLKPFGALTLGEALGLPGAIPLEEFSASDPLPSLVTVKIAPWWRIAYRAHSALLTEPLLCENVRAKDGEGVPWLHPLLGTSHSCSGLSSIRSGRRRDRGPTFNIRMHSSRPR